MWVRHADEELKAGSEAWQIVAELAPALGEAIVEKSYRDAFEGTDLESMLSSLRAGKLLVAGAQTDMCVRSTLHGALVRGYDAILVSDASLCGFLYWHVIDAADRSTRQDIAMLYQGHTEDSVLVAIRCGLRHEEVNKVKAIADASIRSRCLDALQTAFPPGRQTCGLWPDALRVIAIRLVKA
ncbi:hypothetical protein CBM2609_B30266 [Cupriavidus taiwanensis]|uniref:cysteine hydrolase family protein n=1 Tax=Cupriavidus taiwanensis TaxID=164546 RepID=UPI000E14735A|nr:hypothetical protein CBM2604_B40265 [Cupriavidus taiwanensis]SOZ32586.1 hypothetical protein CBM2609_B30266 [Cupriavidus taiwanensis]SOZ48184.1 hypothetical protein CBM2610_B30265 [Cupriavidus taiwanensis]